MRDLRKALGDVYADHKSESEPSTPAASPAHLDEDLAQALSAALADVPSVERLKAPPSGPPRMPQPSQPSPFAFNLSEDDLPELELVDPEPEVEAEAETPEFEMPDFEMAEPETELAPEVHLGAEVKPSAPRPTPKMAAWLKGDMPGGGDMTEPADEALPMPAQVWQLSDDDILPARSGGGRRRRR